MIRKIILFVIVFSALQFTWQASSNFSVSRAFIDNGIVAPAAYMINRITPGAQAYGAGSRLRSPDGGINIVNGCDGLEILFLLLAGFTVAPLAGRSRILAVLAGVPLVYGLNQVRILALFYSHRSNAVLFDAIHGFIGPVAMVIFVAGYFYLWLGRVPPRNAASIM